MNRHKNQYTIYGLRVRNSRKFFYIGVTCNLIKSRLSVHLCHVKGGHETNKQKCEIIKNANFNIQIIPLLDVGSSKKRALRLETKTILRYLHEGHPLVNKSKRGGIPSSSKWENIKLSSEIVQKVRKYIEKKGGTISGFAERAVLAILRKKKILK